MEGDTGSKVNMCEGVKLERKAMACVCLSRAFILESFECIGLKKLKKANTIKKATNYVEVKNFIDTKEFSMVCGSALWLEEVPYNATTKRLKVLRNSVYNDVKASEQAFLRTHLKLQDDSRLAQIKRYLGTEKCQIISEFLYDDPQAIRAIYKQKGLIK